MNELEICKIARSWVSYPMRNVLATFTIILKVKNRKMTKIILSFFVKSEILNFEILQRKFIKRNSGRPKLSS